MLLVWRWRIYRRVKEHDIESVTGFCHIPNDKLDLVFTEVNRLHDLPTGRSIVTGHLRNLDIHIQQKMLIKTVRVDPENSRLRWACLIKRKKYDVSGSNSLWHWDRHYSLINWGFLMHGALMVFRVSWFI